VVFFYYLNIIFYCESNFIRWHQFSWFLTKCIDPWVLEFVVSTKYLDPWVLEFMVSKIIGNNQWKNCILLDSYFHGLSELRNQNPTMNNDFTVSEYEVHVLWNQMNL
jgi:cellulose synthase/poly-beta-1,6-N-acetylglucosamine synthase-like glycosyltransferase